MKVYRGHIQQAWHWEDAAINGLEKGLGLNFTRGPGKGGKKMYELSDILECGEAHFPIMNKRPIQVADIIRLIELVESDKKRPKEDQELTVGQALKVLAKGGIPDYPNHDFAHKVSIAFKNHMDARAKEQMRLKLAGELVDKKVLVDKINEVANLYEDKFGDALFREMERRQDEFAAAAVTDDFYRFVRDFFAQRHDAVIQEVNHIEERVNAGI